MAKGREKRGRRGEGKTGSREKGRGRRESGRRKREGKKKGEGVGRKVSVMGYTYDQKLEQPIHS